MYVDFREDGRFDTSLEELRSALLGLALAERPPKKGV
jgi:hypothetical protein